MTDAVVEALHELIAVTRGATVDRWVVGKVAAELLSYDYTTFVERIAPRPDFPTPMRIDGKGHPRWLRSEVMAWARRHQG